MTTYKLAGIGNAVVDVISNADDSFLDLMGIEKGIMQLIEQDRGEVLYAAMTDRLQTPGGSVANTVAGVGALGLPTAFIGRVRDDALGKSYIDGMQKDGTDFVNAPVEGGDLPTSRSMIFVSPDGERSMNTYLGIQRTYQRMSPAGPRSFSSKAICSTKTKAKKRFCRPRACVGLRAVRQALRSAIPFASTATALTFCA